MKKEYIKPTIENIEMTSEGVIAASGDGIPGANDVSNPTTNARQRGFNWDVD